ncbi:substrate-binding periplasmic protein [Paludibacterium purpuratum]|uniref:Extracellular solute-binding protein (Family 3) n=1 Tax=Paludibacterium purpuratum TaxID=1144873 RepID=A0A4R7B1H3_9NEIS|nr:transporter substrate-binding domain-containing protein [Paludibacterium purpuratum]TDR73304.1 extracellular solute-binding protein (family 3) [Paludibacterium purpuratum]
MRRTSATARIARWLLPLLAVLCLGQARAANTTVLRYAPIGPIYDYRWQVLALAMDHTRASDGPYRLTAYNGETLSQSRLTALLQHNQIDVVSYATSPEREATLRPIRIDILRGMLGYRVLMIRAGDQQRFRHMDTQTLHQRIALGFNSQWADYPILLANGFNVTATVGYDSLFAMLAAGRFDALPRGLNEIRPELTKFRRQYPNLAEEKTLALFVNYPVYFWVNKNNPRLAERIERGLKAALADGTLKTLFLRAHAEEIAEVRHAHRRIVRLTNPQLPPGTPPSDTSWWWDQH